MTLIYLENYIFGGKAVVGLRGTLISKKQVNIGETQFLRDFIPLYSIVSLMFDLLFRDLVEHQVPLVSLGRLE